MRHHYVLGLTIEEWLVWPLLAAIVQVPIMVVANWLALGWLTIISYLLFVLTMTYLLIFMTSARVDRLLGELHEHDRADRTVKQPSIVHIVSAVPERVLAGAALVPAGVGAPLTFLSRVAGFEWVGWLGLGLAFFPLAASFALAFFISLKRSDHS